MEQLKFMVDMDWRIRFEKMDKIFSNLDFVSQFQEFLHTEVGKKWLKSENGQKYIKWQHS
jgi:hypothetical protein